MVEIVLQEKVFRCSNVSATAASWSVRLFVFDEASWHQGALWSHPVATRKQHMSRYDTSIMYSDRLWLHHVSVKNAPVSEI